MHGMWPKGSGVEFKVRLMHADHVNARASDGTIFITFDSQAHVIQYTCTVLNGRHFDSHCRLGYQGK